jgi:hypothetical protein
LSDEGQANQVTHAGQILLIALTLSMATSLASFLSICINLREADVKGKLRAKPAFARLLTTGSKPTGRIA